MKKAVRDMASGKRVQLDAGEWFAMYRAGLVCGYYDERKTLTEKGRAIAEQA